MKSSSSSVCLLLLLYYSNFVDAVVKVVFLGGQSNCQGFGDNTHLTELISDPSTAADYAQYADGSNIATRSDVYVIYEPERGISGPLTAGFGDSANSFGTEMGMGWVLGDYFTSANEPVLIVKHCEVFPLAVEWRPPSSSSGTGGDAYTRAIQTYNDALNNLGQYIPNYDGSGFDVVSFVWMHGYADMYEASYLAEYETNLANLLQDVAAEFPTIQSTMIVQSGGGGENPGIAEAAMRDIQGCVAAELEDSNTRTALVETYLFSGGEPRNGETYIHYFGRADNYIDIGEAIGNNIVEVLDGTYVLNNNACPSTTTPTTTTNNNGASSTTTTPSSAGPTAISQPSPSPTTGNSRNNMNMMMNMNMNMMNMNMMNMMNMNMMNMNMNMMMMNMNMNRMNMMNRMNTPNIFNRPAAMGAARPMNMGPAATGPRGRPLLIV